MSDSILTAPVKMREADAAMNRYGTGEELPLEQRTHVTVDELEKLSLPFPAELYNGRVVYKMPNFAHSVIQGRITQKINNYLDEHPVGLVGGDANYRLWPERRHESRGPDVSFILKERLPKNLFRFLPMAPDLAVEILSPGDSFMEVMEKVDEYLRQGVKIVWVVIANTREVLVCTAKGKYSVRDTLTAPELLPGFELPVQDIFAGVEMSAEDEATPMT
jgi:Uma2 family endonuclease